MRHAVCRNRHTKAVFLAVLAASLGAVQAKPGDFDTGFANGGVAITPVSSAGDDLGSCMAMQSDGKILVAGTAPNSGGNADFAVVRYLPGGTLDDSFGAGGKVITPIGNGNDFATCMTVQTDGKILVAGYALIGTSNTMDFAVVRYLTDGTPDPGFGTGGKVTTDIGNGFNDHAYAVAVQSDGKIVVAGDFRGSFALVRYDAGGTPDPGFGTGGKVSSLPTATEQYAYGMVLQPDGKIVVAGSSLTAGNTDFVIGRFLTSGLPDGAFGTGGKAVFPMGAGNTEEIARGVALQADGKILAAGSSGADYALIRCKDNGELDAGFGVAGKTTIDFGGSTDTGYGVALQSDGKVVVAGTSKYNGSNYASLVRFSAGGLLDNSFGNGGGVIVPLSTATTDQDDVRALALQTDGKILVGGYSGSDLNHDFVVARFTGFSPVSLADWRQSNFGSPDNSGNGANLFDYDNDGLVNVVEYAFGQDPMKGSSSLLPPARISGGNFVINFNQPGSVTGITYGAEWSTTLLPGSWTAISDSGTGGQHVFSVPTAGKPKVSVRLTVTSL